MLEALIKITQQDAGFSIVKWPILVLGIQIIVFYALTHWRYSYLKAKV
jgi:hypothetical protein